MQRLHHVRLVDLKLVELVLDVVGHRLRPRPPPTALYRRALRAADERCPMGSLALGGLLLRGRRAGWLVVGGDSHTAWWACPISNY